MTKKAVIEFIQVLSNQPDILNQLNILPKGEVLKQAKSTGHNFTEKEWDYTIWGIEELLAEKLHEEFDWSFSLWETMWGKFYLEFVVKNVIACLSAAEIADFLKKIEVPNN